jgi:hypothetical protein
MTEDQVLSLAQWDHWPIPKVAGGADAHWNLVPVPILAHREKTARSDLPREAKIRRLTREQEEFRRKVLDRPCGQRRERSKRWPSRKMPRRKTRW